MLNPLKMRKPEYSRTMSPIGICLTKTAACARADRQHTHEHARLASFVGAMADTRTSALI